MPKKEKILRPKGWGLGGCFVPHLKGTAEADTVILPPVDEVSLPLSQHIGAPAKPVVEKGQQVFVGTLIAESGGFVSAPVHSSVSGTVKEVTGSHIIITSDKNMTPCEDLKPFEVNTPEDLANAAEMCGLVGLGGAGFPARVKLTVKEGTEIDTLVVNAAECEPYITSDYRECMENYDDVMNGVYLIKDILGIKNAVICVESNKDAAIKKLYEIATDTRDEDNSVQLMRLPAKYPQGAEKVLIYSATGRKVPAGKLPSDVGCIVMNITSIATLYRFIKTGMPLVSKRITVDGTAVKEPKNILVPIGAYIKDVLDFVGVDEDYNEIIMGGPMMGIDVVSDDSPIEKRNNAITVMKNYVPDVTTACIRCGRCANTCPMNLYPAKVESAVNFGLYDKLNSLNVNYCMECGCCSFVCPAKRPLTQTMRLAKAVLRREKK